MLTPANMLTIANPHVDSSDAMTLLMYKWLTWERDSGCQPVIVIDIVASDLLTVTLCTPPVSFLSSALSSLSPPSPTGRTSSARTAPDISSLRSVSAGPRPEESVHCMEAGWSPSTVCRNRTVCSDTPRPGGCLRTGTGLTVSMSRVTSSRIYSVGLEKF